MTTAIDLNIYLWKSSTHGIRYRCVVIITDLHFTDHWDLLKSKMFCLHYTRELLRISSLGEEPKRFYAEAKYTNNTLKWQ
jgi:hypothetical protein